MTGWIRMLRVRMIPRPRVDVAEATWGRLGEAGAYRPLSIFLRDRYANRVVMTFGEIEELLTFSLPEPARLERAWWGAALPGAQRSAQSAAWTLAGRTAVVNLSARSVVFDRNAE